ncbi:hypothetical protein CYMTET_15022 [Cymbomonas tetramitiformis]|uniref:Photosynthesis system II assembly factor Ycf48/Hcf136-like domain-containing protein n=1 Tax=Cymbomonas tetramitiformis TaxID=36881 RepID=A0AAE0GFF0_9CHLO|nr:hypothetical protein CYMTET_15022 [Cymbomonas tetramitiformis]
MLHARANSFPPFHRQGYPSFAWLSLSVVIFFSLVASSAGYTNLNLPFWYREESSVTTTLNDVSFFEPNVAFAVGERDTILYTDDDGVTWTPRPTGQPQSGLHWYSVSFAEYCVPNPDWRPGFYYFLCSIDRGFVVGSNGKIARTSNRGELWEIQNNFDFSERVDLEAVIAYSKLRHVEAVTSEIAWTVGDGGIILSTTVGFPPYCGTNVGVAYPWTDSFGTL